MQSDSVSTPSTDTSFSLEETMMLKKLLALLFSSNSATTNTSVVEKVVEKEVEKIVYQDRVVEKPVEVIKTVEKIVYQDRIVEKPDPIRSELASMFELVSLVRQDAEFNRRWLGNCEQDSMALIQLTAKLSQWEMLEQLWDSLCSRCKQEKRPLTDQETTLLGMTLSLVNLTSERQASLQAVEVGAPYDYQIHQSVQKQGEKVTDTWLAALVNPAGKVVKQPLVQRG